MVVEWAKIDSHYHNSYIKHQLRMLKFFIIFDIT